VLVTAGPTYEDLTGEVFHESVFGKMGYALAEAAAWRGRVWCWSAGRRRSRRRTA